MKRTQKFFVPLLSLALRLSMSLPACAAPSSHWAAPI